MITAMEILVDKSGYPTEAIARNSHDYRPLGLGYANLGALLMSLALPYDSEGGRDFCGAVTALLLGLIGGVVGGWMASGEPMNFSHYRTRKAIYHQPL